MAKVTPTPRSVAPPSGYSPGYTWMLLFAVLAMAGGAALHYLELTSDYDFVSEPKGLPAVQKLVPLQPRDQLAPKLTRAPEVPGDDRAALPLEAPVAEPRLRPVGPVVTQLPPLLPGLLAR